MTLKEQLAEKKAKLIEIEPMLKADDVTDETIAEGQELVAAIAELEESIARAQKAEDILKNLSTDEEPNTDTEEKTMNEMEMFTKSAKEMTDKKAGVAMHLKAATDVVTSAQIADVDRSIAPQARRTAAAGKLTGTLNGTSKTMSLNGISGNAITYLLQGAYEGTPAATAESAKKTQNSTSFTGTTLALTKIAAYIKETDEILYDEAFLASEVQNSLIAQVGKVEDAYVINAIGSTVGIGAETYDGTTVTFADGILAAILKVKSDSAYDASVVVVNPADLKTLLTAKDQNGQYYGGGYFVGAYGNGSVSIPAAIWGVQIFTSSAVTQGSALICAREAVKIWRKSGIDVRLFEQNEDDAIYNRVTLVGETRLAAAVVDLKGVVLLANSGS